MRFKPDQKLSSPWHSRPAPCLQNIYVKRKSWKHSSSKHAHTKQHTCNKYRRICIDSFQILFLRCVHSTDAQQQHLCLDTLGIFVSTTSMTSNHWHLTIRTLLCLGNANGLHLGTHTCWTYIGLKTREPPASTRHSVEKCRNQWYFFGGSLVLRHIHTVNVI